MASHRQGELESELEANHDVTTITTPTFKTTSDTMGRIKTSASRVAPTHVEASMLRCIRSDTLLHRGAEAFKSQACDAENHQKSFQTTFIDDFMSHEWASNRWNKLLALCLVYNAPAAVVAEFVVGMVAFVLQFGDEPVLPFVRPSVEERRKREFSKALDNRNDEAQLYGCWCSISSTWAFVFFFFFWQDIRCKLGLTTRRCFLDSHCIDQSNPERKAAGILGLAGFLRCSQRIIILWTPRYFTRLWCTYELASWLHLEKQLSSVKFMPLSFATIALSFHTVLVLAVHTIVLSHRLFPAFYLHILGTVLIFFYAAFVHQARHNVANMRAIPEQLANFSVMSSQCYCCSVDHCQNGEEIACDREVVYSTIASWFGSVDGGEQAALDRFDEAIRTRFAMKVLQKAGPTQLSWFYSLFAGHFFLIRAFDLLSAGKQLGYDWFVNTLMRYFASLFVMDVVVKATLHACVFSDKWVGIPSSRVKDVLWSCFFSAACLLLMLPPPYVLQEATYFIDVKFVPMALVLLSSASLSMWCHCEEVDDWLRKHSNWYRTRRPERLADLPPQVTDAIPDEGRVVLPPSIQDPDSEGTESQVEPLPPASPLFYPPTAAASTRSESRISEGDEGELPPPPFVERPRDVRIAQKPDSDGTESQVEAFSPLSPKSLTSSTPPTAHTSARSESSMPGGVPLPLRFMERLDTQETFSI